MAENGCSSPVAKQPPLPPHKVLSDYYGSAAQRRAYVGRLFDVSARHYDRITDVMSFGSGRWYRRQALTRAGVAPGMALLDVGCGTGVIAAIAADMVGPDGFVVALDPSPGMLKQAALRVGPTAVQGMGEGLPFAERRFDRLTMGYALRHVADLRDTFREYRRVLKPGGSVLLLEITRPTSTLAYYPLKGYLKYAIPAMTRLFSRSRDAQTLMSYYWDTIEHCVDPERILTALRDSGFSQVERHIELGIFSEYRAYK